ncbi:MAG: enoyl-CoA hydratase/isomerase family protein [Deltaproteobacteria bacterium]|nr:enoyl-CoA hydratase/isomerase family protein [Deltaproteobacteria bacterium]
MSICTYTVDGNGVALMTLDNPPMNALSYDIVSEIRACVQKALADNSVRVVVFTGAGKAFIAGADIKELERNNSKEVTVKYLENGHELMNLIESADKPFIAAINGFALGGGCELALACHIRLADESAQIGLPEIKLGIIPGYGGTIRTPQLAGLGRTYELILSGNFISGKQAAEYNLVNRAVPKGESVNEAKRLALAIAKKGRPAIKTAMDVIRKGRELGKYEAQQYEREGLGALTETENKREGVAAFFEKREARPVDK